jgi:uncharacterized protein YbjQ (UPF0145 family)
MNEHLVVVTTPVLPDHRVVKVLGVVHGLTVRTRGFGGKISASFQSIIGGEVTAYTSECEKAREESMHRLVENARAMGANAVIAADFETSAIMGGFATVFATYGTAVVVEQTYD